MNRQPCEANSTLTGATRLRERISHCSLHLFVACALATLTACANFGPHEPAPTSPPIQADSSVGTYLSTMDRLALGDPAQQADVFYDVERSYTGAPTTSNTLRYAVALTTPGHPASDMVKGKKLLEQLLATPERLDPNERMLAEVLLKHTDARLQLQAENRRLLATVDERSKAQANSDRRAQSQAEENARLRKALDEARQKLDAIRDIERSIIERSPTTPRSPSGTREPAETQSPPAGR